MEWLEAWRLTLKALLLPPTSLFALLLLGLLLHSRVWGRLLAWSSAAALYLLSVPVTSDWLATQLETVPPIQAEWLPGLGAEAILVLSAGQNHFNPELDGQARVNALSMQRLSYAVHLHRVTGLPLIVSGGTTEKGEEPLAEVGARWLREQAQVEPLALERHSRTTWENLANSSPLLRQLGIRRVALVTHAFHMRRALLAAQAHSVDAIPAAFGFISHEPPPEIAHPTWRDWLPSSGTAVQNHLLLHEWLGYHWYRSKR